MLGKCAVSGCEVLDGVEADVATCSFCTQPVHRMCSNSVYKGGLDVHVCSQKCRGDLIRKGKAKRGVTGTNGISGAGYSISNKSTLSKRFRLDDDGLHCSVVNSEDERKKYFFTAANDLDLLREVLNVRPFAAKHGTKTAFYQDVADNLNEKWGTKLAMRTVKERFFLLLKQFKAKDCEYRKKAGGKDEYTEHKKLLQDITDAIETAKKAKRAGKTAKADQELSGETLREQQGESQVCDEDETRSDASFDAEISAANTDQLNAVLVAFMAQQSKRHDMELELRQEELRFKKAKAEREEARWKEDIQLRKLEAANKAKRWSEEMELRRNDMELRRQELAVFKRRLGLEHN